MHRTEETKDDQCEVLDQEMYSETSSKAQKKAIEIIAFHQHAKMAYLALLYNCLPWHYDAVILLTMAVV